LYTVLLDIVILMVYIKCIECTEKILSHHSFYMFFERHPDAALLGNLREAYMCHECFVLNHKKNNREWYLCDRRRWDKGKKEFLYCNFGNPGHNCPTRGKGKGYVKWEETHLTGIVLKEPHQNFNALGMDRRQRYDAVFFYAECTPPSVRKVLDKVPIVVFEHF